jgi:hypothetical protein
MANITVTSTGYWGDDSILSSGSWSGLVWNETVTIQDGAVCTVDPGVRSPTGIDVGANIICIAGFSKLVFNNTSTTVPVKYYGPTSGTLQVESGCEWIVNGDWITIHTGDGSEGQTTSGWTDAGFLPEDEPGGLWVETGDGTNVFEEWANVGHTTNGLGGIGVGVLGRWFSYNNATGVITFGNGGKPNAVTSAAGSGQPTINVTVGADFTVGDYVHIIEGTVRETIIISSISSNELTMTTNLVNSYTTAAIVRIVKGGNIVPTGSRVRTPNISIGTINSGGVHEYNTTLANNFRLDCSPGGVLNFACLILFGFYLNVSSAGSLNVTYVSGLTRILLSSSPSSSLSHVIIGICRYFSSELEAFLLPSYSISQNCIITNCFFSRKSIHVVSGYPIGCTFTDCLFIITERGLSYASRPLNFTEVINLTVRRCLFVGSESTATYGNGNLFEDCSVSESPHGAPYGSNNPSALLSTPGTFDTIINNLAIIPDGSATGISYILAGGTTVINCNITRSDLRALSLTYSIPEKIIQSVLVVLATSTIGPIIGSSTNYSITIQNIKTNSFGNTNWTLPTANYLIFKGYQIPSTTFTLSLGAVTDTHFYELHTSTDGGLMGIMFTPKKSHSGYECSNDTDLLWNYNGSLYIPVAGGWIEYTWPHTIIGITGFSSGGLITIDGSGTGNFTITYKIDVLDGNGWTDWVTLSIANLSSHTINPLLGFKFKLKISHSVGSMSDYLNKLHWSTDVDYDNYLYPIDTVNVTLQNIVDGSRYYIYNQTTAKEIASGVQSGSADIIIPDVPYNGVNEILLIRVRKGGGGSDDYKPFETNATLTEDGATVWISQVLDDLTT